MSSTRSVPAPPAPPNTRELRALRLYEERRAEIVLVDTDTYEVPSCTGSGFYLVEYGGGHESCNCPDARRHPNLSCKHVLAVAICRAKRRGASLVPDHARILEDARRHPERTYRETVEAAQEIAAEEYRREIRAMMDAGTLDDEL